MLENQAVLRCPSPGSHDNWHNPFSFCPMLGWVFSFPILVFGSSKGWVCFQEPPSTTPSVYALLSHSPPAGCLASPGGEHTVVDPGRRQCSQKSTCFRSGIVILNELTHKEWIDSYTTRQPLLANSKGRERRMGRKVRFSAPPYLENANLPEVPLGLNTSSGRSSSSEAEGLGREVTWQKGGKCHGCSFEITDNWCSLSVSLTEKHRSNCLCVTVTSSRATSHICAAWSEMTVSQ